MTQNQINFARLQMEDKHRSEDERIKWAGHYENIRQFGISTNELIRHNLASEDIGIANANANLRNAKAQEQNAATNSARLQWEKNTYIPNYVGSLAKSNLGSGIIGGFSGAAVANAATKGYNEGLLAGVKGKSIVSGVANAASRLVNGVTDFFTIIDSRLLDPQLRLTTAKKGIAQ